MVDYIIIIMKNFIAIKYELDDEKDWKAEAKRNSDLVWEEIRINAHKAKLLRLGIWINETVWA